jgi:serine/threonine protein phosphatase 1
MQPRTIAISDIHGHLQALDGHTPQKSGQILDRPHLKCIDTGCGYGGLLTALDVGSGQIWQVDERGKRG